MTKHEHISLLSTVQLLIALQQEKFNLFRAVMINSLQKELDRQLNLLKGKV